MAFGIHYRIPFKSLRNGTDYVVNIYDESGASAVTLTGGAEPFTTQEDDTDDMFTPIRTQTGYLRLVDTGSVNWRDIMPQNDLQKPVTLTVAGTAVWQGFLQSQNYGGTLYGNPQERELPVQCCLSVLRAIQVTTTETELHNFAWLLKYCIDSIPSYMNSTKVIENVVVQGGNDARLWLLKRVDWANYINTNDEENDSAKYNLYELLEDICQFWGWTARVMQRTLYLTAMDDGMEQTLLNLTYAQLTTMARGTSAGSVTSVQSATTLSGDIFVSTANEDMMMRGPSKATVKADCNRVDTVFKFAPKVIQDAMDAAGSYSWTQGTEDRTGYFATPLVRQIGTSTSSAAYRVMTGSFTGHTGGFQRRQIFSATEDTEATKADCIVLPANRSTTSVLVNISLNRERSYSNGSLSLKGTIYQGAKTLSYTEASSYGYFLIARIGIGTSRSDDNTKWYQLSRSGNDCTSTWTSTPYDCLLYVSGAGEIQGFCAAWTTGSIMDRSIFPQIPTPADAFGKIFIDIVGFFLMNWTYQKVGYEGVLANMEVGFSRDVTYMPSHEGDIRPRTMETEREETHYYRSSNNGQTHDEWNADVIYASDNNMEYGYGLMMEPDGSFVKYVPYNNGGSSQIAEQHLAERVTYYWRQNRRKIVTEVTYSAAAVLTPIRKAVIDGTQTIAVSISHNWRDDITQLTLMEI